MRRVPIRMKLALALAVPLLALATVTALEVRNSADDVADIEGQTALARISIGPAGVVTALQDERAWTILDLIGSAGDVPLPVADQETARRNTDEALERFRAEVGDVGGLAADAYGPALEAVAGLEALRADVDRSDQPHDLTNIPLADDVFGRYSELVTPFLDATSEVAVTIDDPEMRIGVELVDITTRQVEDLAELSRSTLVSTVSTGGIDQPDEIRRLAALQASFNSRVEALVLANARYGPIISEHAPTQLNEDVDALVDAAIATGTTDLPNFLATVYVPADEGYTGLRSLIADSLGERADELNRAASSRDNWFIVLALATLATALTLTWLVSRSITRPLRSLTRQAKDLAGHRLPDAVLDILETPLGDDVRVPETVPVTVHTRDEVGDVAAALNTVQDTALELAVEQAVLRRNIADSFVNLGRRNQNLLGRQLDFITELESNETDPDTLASLFRLDHLATRMRRNAESLLVLAGIDPPRKWASPVRLTDVIRAALGEVEDYQRVSVRGVEPATIVGSAAADLAHLLAELIENALVFSPPDQTVEIRGRSRPNGYTLAIIDSGLGMTPTDIESANRRLAGAESFTIAPSKYLGHYVAGNLAARHDIGVHLDNSPGNGVTATIDIPPALLTTDAVLDEQPPARAPQLAPSSNGSHPPAPLFPVAGAPALDAAPTPPPRPLATPPSRTASGLVKRAPRSSPEPDSPAPSMPAGDLLASLSHVAGTLGERRRGRVLPPTSPGQQATAPPGEAQGPPARRTPGGPATPPWSPPAGRRVPPPAPPAGRRVPPPAPPARPAPHLEQAHGQDRTPSGLARRVRGAQLPNTQFVSLRRGGEHPPAGGGDYGRSDRSAAPQGSSRWNGDGNGNGNVDPRQQHEHSSARDVYSFLTSFTAGVQRGLDEAGNDTPPEENP